MKLGLNPTLEIEASIVNNAGETVPLVEQVFYVLEQSPKDLLRGNDVSEVWYAKTMNALRNHASVFVITDARGKDETNKLKEGTYFICGISQMVQGVGVWNVEIEVKRGKNNLTLNNENMTTRQKM